MNEPVPTEEEYMDALEELEHYIETLEAAFEELYEEMNKQYPIEGL